MNQPPAPGWRRFTRKRGRCSADSRPGAFVVPPHKSLCKHLGLREKDKNIGDRKIRRLHCSVTNLAVRYRSFFRKCAEVIRLALCGQSVTIVNCSHTAVLPCEPSRLTRRGNAAKFGDDRTNLESCNGSERAGAMRGRDVGLRRFWRAVRSHRWRFTNVECLEGVASLDERSA